VKAIVDMKQAVFALIVANLTTGTMRSIVSIRPDRRL
jgi:hypothetical protein